MSEARFAALASFENSGEFNAVERLALRYAVKMTETPVNVPQELFDALRAQFNERQMVELTSALAWENYRARFDHAFGIESEGFMDGDACPLPGNPSSKKEG